MSKITEILQKQAEAVKQNFNTIKKAEQLEAEAKALRAQANKPVMADFKAIAKAKQANVSKFSNALQEGKLKRADFILKSNNWIMAFQNANEVRYAIKNTPGYSIKIKDGKFSVNYFNEEKISSLPIENLETYLETFNKK